MLDDVWETPGPIDGLVNNAGIIRRADAVDFTEADWDDVMDVNLKSLFFLCQAFGRRVLADRAGAARSSTSPRCCPSRAASASPPTPRRSTACSASPGCSPANGRPRASTSTRSRRAISRPTTPRRCAPIRTAARPSSARIPAGRWGEPGRHRRRGGVPAGAGLGLHARRGGAGRWRLAGAIGVLRR